MKVFRIEDDEGRGMYRACYGVNGYRRNFGDIAGLDEAAHPSPSDDQQMMDQIYGKGMAVYSSLFGFASETQLRRWVYRDEWLVELKRAGWRLSIYEIPDYYVCVGTTQCIMSEWYASQQLNLGLVQHHDLCRYFNIYEEA